MKTRLKEHEELSENQWLVALIKEIEKNALTKNNILTLLYSRIHAIQSFDWSSKLEEECAT